MNGRDSQEQEDEESPLVIIFAGPNGSGKSTVNKRVLRNPELNFQGEYINADDIARSLEAEIPDYRTRNIRAAQIAEQRRKTAMEEGRPFAFETVMSTPEKVAIMTQAKAKGYDVSLVFVTTDDPERNIVRIANRVAKGEHDVDPDAVRRRYHRTMALLACAIEHADAALIVDTSSSDAALDVAVKQDGQLQIVADETKLPNWVADKLIKPYHEREASRRTIEKSFRSQCADSSVSLPAVLADADAGNGKIYHGKIVELTTHHTLQQTSVNHFIIHDRSLSAPRQDLQIGQQATIGYAYDKGKIVTPALSDDRAAASIGNHHGDLSRQSVLETKAPKPRPRKRNFGPEF